MSSEGSFSGEKEKLPKFNLNSRSEWLEQVSVSMNGSSCFSLLFSFLLSVLAAPGPRRAFFSAVYFGVFFEGRDGHSGSLSGNESWTAGGCGSHSPPCHLSPSEGSRQLGGGLPNEDRGCFRLCPGAASPLTEVTFRSTTHYRVDIGQGWDTY